MNIRTALYDSSRMLMMSLYLMVTRPYLLFYLVIPVGAPLVLVEVADYHRMFDLVLHYRPVMSSVTYALIGLQLLFTVFLARRAMYLLYKKKPPHPFVSRGLMLVHSIVWIALSVGGIWLFTRMALWAQTTLKNPTITKFAETSATLTSQLIPLLIFVGIFLALLWRLTALVIPIIATEKVSLMHALTKSLSIAWRTILPFIFLYLFFALLELIPTLTPLAIARRYKMVKSIAPYALQLILSTWNVITYCVFYTRYKTEQSH